MTAADKPEFAPAIGNMPSLQWCRLDQLQVDDAYQRSIDTPGSQSMIRTIARNWNWDLCQPLFVARRSDTRLYVVDGQHRLAAARMRSDIDQLPCIVSLTDGPAQEASLFSEFNRHRRSICISRISLQVTLSRPISTARCSPLACRCRSTTMPRPSSRAR